MLKSLRGRESLSASYRDFYLCCVSCSLCVSSAGAVGDADLYVSNERTLSSTRGDFLWSSEDFGSDWIFISSTSSATRRVCNEEIVKNRGACVFFILVKASEDAQYTIEVRQEVGGYELLLPDGKPLKDFIRRGHTRTFAYLDVSAEQDLRISGNLVCDSLHVELFVLSPDISANNPC